MGLRSYCSECGAETGTKHKKTCTANMFKPMSGTDYIRYPATTIKFDTPEEQAEWLSNLKGGSANTEPKRELATPDQLSNELDEILVLFSKRLAVVQGEHNANLTLSTVQKHAEEAQEEAKAALLQLLEDSSNRARVDELNRFVNELGSISPFVALPGTPREYVESKWRNRVDELKALSTKKKGWQDEQHRRI